MNRQMIHVPGGKYARAKNIQDRYRSKGIWKPMYDCLVEVELEDKAMNLMSGIQRGFKRARFKL